MRTASGPPNARLVAAITLICISAFFLIKTVRRQKAISQIYAAKNICGYKSKKSLIIFLDDRSVAAMKKFGITSGDILAEANAMLEAQKIDVGYDIANAKIRTWNSDPEACVFSDANFSDENACFLEEISPRIRKEKKKYNPDLFVFVTANGVGSLSGKSYWKKDHGNGTIVMNLGIDLNSYDSDRKLKAVARKFFRKKFAQLLIHEHAHTYGVPHSSVPFSIMQSGLNELGSHRAKFDRKSVRIFHEKIEDIRRQRKFCVPP